MDEIKANFLEAVEVTEPTESCELTLSADKKWLRLVVGGKMTASFHVNYVNKVLGNEPKKINSERTSASPNPSPNL